MVGVNTYPVFEQNQVLNHDHLNSLVEYLDEQNRYTRCKLIGIGIVCGLNISVNNQNQVTVSKGCGITSEGYIACLDEGTTYTHYKAYNIPNNYKPFNPENPGGTSSEITILELVKEPEDANPLTAAVLNNKVVLAFVEYTDEAVESCLTDNCDEHGKWRSFELRFLLLSRSDVEKIQEISGELNAKYRLEAIALERICCISKQSGMNDKLNIAELNTSSELARLYAEATESVLNILPNIIRNAYNTFSPVLANQIGIVRCDKAIILIEEIHKYIVSVINEDENIPITIQYLYDFVKDLICAYEEFIEEAFDLMAECCPDTGIFPRHLLLGEANPSQSTEPSIYRSHFLQPPIYNRNAERLKRVVMLFDCLLTMVERYLFFGKMEDDVDFEELPITITPSKGLVDSLGARAIPFYYSADKSRESIHQCWNFDKSKKCKADLNLSYHSDKYSEVDFVNSPLCYSLDKYPFYRIEGQLGKKAEEAYRKIDDIRTCRNLPFELLMLYIGERPLIASSENYGYEDLQVTYSIWRNKILLFLTNIIGITHHVERNWLKTNERRKDITKANKELFSITSDKMVFNSLSKAGLKKESAEMKKMYTAEESAVMFGLEKDASYKKSVKNFNRYLENASGKAGKIGIGTAGIGITGNEGIEDTTGEGVEYLSPEEKFIKDTLADLNEYMRGLIRYLALDLKEFDLDQFTEVYLKCIYMDVEIIKYLVSRVTKEDYDDNVYLILQICSWVHRLLSTLAIRPYTDIRLLIDNFQQRELGTTGSLNFFDFIKENTGVEHQAGVSKGGTFILVYQSESDDDSDFSKENQGKIIADFSLPYIYRAKDAQRPIVAKPLTPLVTPKCLVIRPFDDKEKDLLVFPEDEIMLLNNVYDPDVFIPTLTTEPKFGTAKLEDRIYEPDTDRKKKVLVYQVEKEKVDKALKEDPSKTILIEEFEYEIGNASENRSVGKSTVTVFICTEPDLEYGKTLITGRVYSGSSMAITKPVVLAGAEISYSDGQETVKTDSRGFYSLEILPGTYDFTASASNHGSEVKRLQIEEGTNTLNFELNKISKEFQKRYGEVAGAMKYKLGSKEATDIIKASDERISRYKKEVEDIKGDKELKSDAIIYATADTMKLLADEPDIDIKKLNNIYNKAQEDLANNIKISKGKDKELQITALKNLNFAYIERLALEQPKKLSKTSEDALGNMKKQEKEIPELKMETDLDNWSNNVDGLLPDSFVGNARKIIGI